MLKKTVITFISIFMAVSFPAFAVSPQQNTEAVQKALNRMQQALHHKDFKYTEHKNIKDNVSAQTNIDTAKISKTDNITKGSDNKTENTKKSILPVNKTSIKKDNSTANTNNTEKVKKQVKSIQKNISTKRLKNKKPFLTSHTVVKNIKITVDSVIINYTGNIKYHTFRITAYKITAIDIIAPKKVYSYMKNTIIPKDSGIIKKVVTAYHHNNCDKCVYGKPFFRIAINLYKNVSHTVIRKHNKLIIKFSKKGILNNNAHHTVIRTSIKSKKAQTQKPQAQLAKTYRLSLKSISRIISPYPIKKVIYSKEKYIQLQVINNSIYIKPLPIKILLPDGSFAYNYSKQPRDIYVITDTKVYSLHFVFLDIPSVTYNLEHIHSKLLTELQQAKTTFLQDSSTEPYAVNFPTNTYISSILSLIKSAYHGSTLTGYNILPFVKKEDNLHYDLIGQYILRGQYILYAYKIKAHERINLNEKDYANLVNNPLAITIVKSSLLAGDSTMLFIVGGK